VADVDERIARIRGEFDALIAHAREHLVAGAPVERIQGHYVAAAFQLLEDAEARAVLASGGDRAALESLDQDASRLEALHAALLAEFPR